MGSLWQGLANKRTQQAIQIIHNIYKTEAMTSQGPHAQLMPYYEYVSCLNLICPVCVARAPWSSRPVAKFGQQFIENHVLTELSSFVVRVT
jgi:hypothetical protein